VTERWVRTECVSSDYHSCPSAHWKASIRSDRVVLIELNYERWHWKAPVNGAATRDELQQITNSNSL